MTSFTDQLATLGEIPSASALEPGRIMWLHGIKQARLPGVFYVKATELNGTPESPWVVDDGRFEDEHGYNTPTLHIAIIGERSQWFVPGDKDNSTPTQWLREYQAGAKKLNELLILAEGIAEPMVLSASGLNKAKPIIDALHFYRNGLLRQASRIAKVQLPLWSFWLPFRNKLDSNGKVAYIEATDGQGKSYGSIVTPPALHLPENAMDALFVGKELLERGADVAREYAGWFKARRLEPGTVEGEVVTVKALPAPQNWERNQPQALPEDGGDIPF